MFCLVSGHFQSLKHPYKRANSWQKRWKRNSETVCLLTVCCFGTLVVQCHWTGVGNPTRRPLTVPSTIWLWLATLERWWPYHGFDLPFRQATSNNWAKNTKDFTESCLCWFGSVNPLPCDTMRSHNQDTPLSKQLSPFKTIMQNLADLATILQIRALLKECISLTSQ